MPHIVPPSEVALTSLVPSMRSSSWRPTAAAAGYEGGLPADPGSMVCAEARRVGDFQSAGLVIPSGVVSHN